MEINMKDVRLGKKDNWIVIAEELNADGSVAKGTKLLLDDGKYSNSTQLDLLRDRLAKYSEFNNVDSWDKLESGIDWLTTAGLAFWGSGGTIKRL